MNKQSVLVALLSLLLGITQVAELRAQTHPYGAGILNGGLSYGYQEKKPYAMHSVMKFPQALYVAE